MATENTHSAVIASAGQTAAGSVSLGSITLPAGGPWKIHNVFGQVVRATATAGESNGGYLEIQTGSGDIIPQPAPARFPLNESGSSLGATIDQSICQLHIYDVDYDAAGKAVINFFYVQATTVTAAPQLVVGVMFGKEAPVALPIQRCDVIRAAINSAAETAVGTITLAETASLITGICCTILQDNVLTTAEEIIGFIRGASDDIDLTPFQIPFANAYGAGLGALINGASGLAEYFIPLAIPIIGGARINFTCDLNTALTNNAEVQVALAYR